MNDAALAQCLCSHCSQLLPECPCCQRPLDKNVDWERAYEAYLREQRKYWDREYEETWDRINRTLEAIKRK